MLEIKYQRNFIETVFKKVVWVDFPSLVSLKEINKRII